MNENIILNKNPRIELQLFNDGFKLIDEQTKQNSGFYAYNNIQSTDLNKLWFPKLAKFLIVLTWICNGVPFFPDAESGKKSNISIHFKKNKLGIHLIDNYMIRKAKMLKELLDTKMEYNNL
ncbi:hypothetical protein [Polaribacter porphyrae]|uniref:Uncharacterized protein n=1 Tax=Polaribacter porphyrae TaxID=1137780 RepID=A0A2S7WLX7_9FLAO|nr:hypothetical protein [Polaribacter porphyrae]PQJ78614.1 hypothetical protein BTO18_05165 [Polaribacter porphyrae]